MRFPTTDSRPGTCPLGIALAAGFAVATVGCLPAALTSPSQHPTPRLVALALLVAGFTAVVRNLTAAVLTAGMAWSTYLGFLVERAGELHWHGNVDLVRLGVLVTAALLGSTRWSINGLP